MGATATYLVRRAGGAIFAEGLSEVEIRSATSDGIDRLWSQGPYRIKRPDDAKPGFGPERPKGEILDIISAAVPKADPGLRFVVDKASSMQDGKRLVIKKVLISDGSAMLQVALAQLGDDYNWGSEGPERFDCSGLTKFCAAQVDVYLPHSADQQMKLTGTVVQFRDASKLKDGDLVGYNVGRLPGYDFDHIGVVDAPGSVVDASSSYDMVVHRPIDSNPIKAYGRILHVNGPL